MSLWDKISDPWGIISKGKEIIQHAVGYQNASDRRLASSLINDQIKAYRNQTEITRAETAAKKNEQVAEKRRVEEKQIRSLRRSYRPQGFLGGATTDQADMNPKLGG